jgi:hypothetical protein
MWIFLNSLVWLELAILFVTLVETEVVMCPFDETALVLVDLNLKFADNDFYDVHWEISVVVVLIELVLNSDVERPDNLTALAVLQILVILHIVHVV